MKSIKKNLGPNRTAGKPDAVRTRPQIDNLFDVLAAMLYLSSIVSLVSVLVLVVFSSARSEPATVAAVYSVGAFTGLAAAIFSRQAGAVQLVINLFFAVFVSLPSLIQVETATFPFRSHYSTEELNSGFFLVSVGHLSFLIGIAVFSSRRMRDRYSERQSKTGSTPAAISSASARIAVILAIVALLVAATGGPSNLFIARFDSGRSLLNEAGFSEQLIYVARGISIVSLVIGIVSYKISTHQSARLRYRLMLVLVCVQCVIVNFPAALPRFQLFAVLVAISVVLLDFGRIKVKLAFCAAAVYFILFLFPSIKDLRKVFSPEFKQQEDQVSYLQTADFDSFKQIADTIIYFSANPHRLGENFIGAVLFWIPRDLWSSKPLSTGMITSEGLGYPYTNVSSPLPAEAYASFGLLGTVFVLLLVGWLTQYIDQFSGSSPIMLVASAITAGYATILMRGALNAVAPMILPAFVVLALAAFFFHRLTSSKPES